MDDKALNGYTERLGSEGFLVVLEAALPAGAPLTIQCAFGEVCYLNLSGQVVFCRQITSSPLEGEGGGEGGFPQHAIGIKFSGLREFEKKILISAIQELKQHTLPQEKSLLTILVSKDTLALEAADTSIRTTFMAKVTNYRRAEELRSQGLYLYMRPLRSACGPRVNVCGREMIMLASYNYLGLATHPKVKEAARAALEKFGIGAGGPRLLSGNYDLHEELESKLASFKGGEACVVYNSGYSTNLGTIASLLEKGDVAILDKKDHASIFDGSYFSRCRVRTFDHNNMNHLEEVLRRNSENCSCLIVVDSIYSMDGDLADLTGIYALSKKYHAVLMIDEAHATGVLGKTGRGAAEHFGLEGKIDIVMGTLSKALGGLGGFIVGRRELIAYLKHNARPFVFSVALPPMICAAMLAALEVIESEPQWRTRLLYNTSFMRKGLQALGFDTANSSTPIIPVIIGDELKTYRFAKLLERMGVFACPVAWPAVDCGSARLRVNVMATHSEADLSEALDVFKKAGVELGII